MPDCCPDIDIINELEVPECTDICEWACECRTLLLEKIKQAIQCSCPTNPALTAAGDERYDPMGYIKLLQKLVDWTWTLCQKDEGPYMITHAPSVCQERRGCCG